MLRRNAGGFDHGLAVFSMSVFGILSFLVGIVGFKTHRMLMKIILSEARRRKVRRGSRGFFFI